MTVQRKYGHLSAEYEQRRRRYKSTSKIVEWLGNGDFDSLLNAKELLDRTEDPSAEILRRIVRIEVSQRQKGRLELLLGLGVTSLLVLILCLWDHTSPGSFYTLAPCVLMPVWLLMPLLIVWAEKQFVSSRRLRNAVTLLGREFVADAVGELIEAKNTGDAQTRSLAADALTVLLPRLSVEQGAKLTQKHLSMLYQELFDNNENLILAVLTVLERIGDRRAIPAVRRMTQCPVWFVQYTQIQTTAKRCLAHLESLSVERREMQTLLRSSHETAFQAEDLLRPAECTLRQDIHNLLRASSGQSDTSDG